MDRALKLKDLLVSSKKEIISLAKSEFRELLEWGAITEGRMNELKKDALSIGVKIIESENNSYSIFLIGSPTGELISLFSDLSDKKIQKIRELTEVYKVFCVA